jgi:hypothetical protein
MCHLAAFFTAESAKSAEKRSRFPSALSALSAVDEFDFNQSPFALLSEPPRFRQAAV